MEQQAIKERIEELKGELATARGTPTEVYARIVGYYRSVRNWNAGKREEFKIRSRYAAPVGAAPVGSASVAVSSAAAAPHLHLPEGNVARMQDSGIEASGDGHYLLFTRKTCPNCPPVKAALAGSSLKGFEIDVDAAEGLEKARQYGVMAAPTAIFFGTDGKERARALNARELGALITAKTGGANVRV